MQFSEVYRTRSHSAQRSVPIAGSAPSISDVHHAIKFNAKIHEALDLTLQKLRADEAERVEREAREAAERRQQTDRVEDASRVRKEPADGCFNPPDPKKPRRGVRVPSPLQQIDPEDCEKCIWLMDQCCQRAAPPGRCHACNRAETPEWRRGPDGARTLCNACGLRRSNAGELMVICTDTFRLRKAHAQARRAKGRCRYDWFESAPQICRAELGVFTQFNDPQTLTIQLRHENGTCCSIIV